MKSALISLTLLSLCVSACGEQSARTASTQSSSAGTTTATATTTATVSSKLLPRETRVDADQDNDVDPREVHHDNNRLLDYGHPANASDERAIKSLVKRYYTAALASDGAKACSMIYSTFAEAIPEDYGKSPPGASFMQGTTCPAVMTLFFRHAHAHIKAYLSQLRVIRVRLVEHHGLAVLASGSLPEREIQVAREGHHWRVQDLLDHELP